ncbi:MAG: lipopolysaccharide heptosyltransferase I [Arenicellales bacterium]
MKLLLVKTSSLGDVVQTFPALSDARRRIEDLVCDWVVEETYADLPAWHPAVRHVIPVAMRGWRRPPWLQHLPAVTRFIRRLRQERYDLVLDAQGLLKSAVLTRLARGRRAGLAAGSAREPLAARLYDQTMALPAGGHAIDRNRSLFAAALRYDIPESLDYGLRLPGAAERGDAAEDPYLVFIPGTTWPSKRWPPRHWRALAQAASDAGWRVRVISGTPAEGDTARAICEGLPNAEAPAAMSIPELARALHGARAVVSVDSGPGHLAAAVGTPGVSIYGATDPALTGIRGAAQRHLSADFECSPCLERRCRFTDHGQVHPDCYATVPPERVWGTLTDLIQLRERSL